MTRRQAREREQDVQDALARRRIAFDQARDAEISRLRRQAKAADALLPLLRSVAGIHERCRGCDRLGPSALHLTHAPGCPVAAYLTARQEGAR